MGHRVVCISLVTGAGAETVGRLVAARLGFRYVDDEVIAHAAATAGVDRAILESAEHHQGVVAPMVEAIFARPVEIEDDVTRAESASGSAVAPPAEELRRLIEHAIVEIARRGEVVIVAHAAALALRGRVDALRVHVVASRETRIRRLAIGTTLVGESEYAKLLAESDLHRAEYLARFYAVTEELATLYDLVINTDALDLKQVAATVVTAATVDPQPTRS